jgi:hypothetical protein
LTFLFAKDESKMVHCQLKSFPVFEFSNFAIIKLRQRIKQYKFILVARVRNNI